MRKWIARGVLLALAAALVGVLAIPFGWKGLAVLAGGIGIAGLLIWAVDGADL